MTRHLGRLSWFPLATFLLTLTACGSDDGWGGPEPYRDQGAVSFGESGSEVVPIWSVEQYARLVDAVVLATPIRREADWWDATNTVVKAHFTLRVDHVYAGDLKVGEEILVRLPGGTAAKYFPATGSRRPRDGEETFDERLEAYPYFRDGVHEVVFLSRERDYWSTGAYSRYHLWDGKLQSVVPDDVDTADAAGIKEMIEGAGEAGIAALIAEAKARPVPERKPEP